MSEIPSLPYDRIIRALQKDGWIIIRQRGSHIRLQRRIENELLNLTERIGRLSVLPLLTS